MIQQNWHCKISIFSWKNKQFFFLRLYKINWSKVHLWRHYEIDIWLLHHSKIKTKKIINSNFSISTRIDPRHMLLIHIKNLQSNKAIIVQFHYVFNGRCSLCESFFLSFYFSPSNKHAFLHFVQYTRNNPNQEHSSFTFSAHLTAKCSYNFEWRS